MTAVNVPTQRAADAPPRAADPWLAAFGEIGPGAMRGAGAAAVVHGGERGPALVVTGEPGASFPSTATAASVGVVFDGVLYNGAELSNQLSIAGGAALEDADVVLHAYQRWGEEALGKIKGVFALVIRDAARDLLFCVRDRMGIYPFFYADTGRELLASTSVDAITRHPRVSTAPNREALADRLCGRFYNVHETYLADVQRLAPGHVLRVAGGERRTYRYWNPEPPRSASDWVRDDASERFEVALEEAVNRSMVFGSAGIFLSGGLDSVSIAALAAESSQARGLQTPWALSLLFPDPECNEEPVQKGVAKDLGLPHVLLTFEEAVGRNGLMERGLEYSRTAPLPLLNFWLPAYTRLGAEGVQRGCRAILNGSGGDEWLGVTPYLAADLIKAFDVAGLYRLWNSQRRSYDTASLILLREMVWRFGTRPILASAATRALRVAAPSVLRRRKLRYIARSTPAYVASDTSLRQRIDSRAEESIPDPHPGPFYLHEMNVALDHLLPSLTTEDNFELGRRIGAAMCSPYWDADLIDLLYRVHPDALNRGGRSKGMVRQAMARRFPNLGFASQKKVVSINYFASTVRTEWRAQWERIGGLRVLPELGLVDPVAFKAHADDVLARGVQRESFRIWDVLNLEVWARART